MEIERYGGGLFLLAVLVVSGLIWGRDKSPGVKSPLETTNHIDSKNEKKIPKKESLRLKQLFLAQHGNWGHLDKPILLEVTDLPTKKLQKDWETINSDELTGLDSQTAGKLERLSGEHQSEFVEKYLQPKIDWHTKRGTDILKQYNSIRAAKGKDLIPLDRPERPEIPKK